MPQSIPSAPMMCVPSVTVPERTTVPPELRKVTVTFSHHRRSAASRTGSPALSRAGAGGAEGGGGAGDEGGEGGDGGSGDVVLPLPPPLPGEDGGPGELPSVGSGSAPWVPVEGTAPVTPVEPPGPEPPDAVPEFVPPLGRRPSRTGGLSAPDGP
ncbi:hypothetical protein ACF1B0_11675 [Streptomyces anandii]|uniref:hypothetical protein n=1 Tax=Streptomyces anandii TaxID=285454 RepID=UPI0037030A4A